MKRDDIVAEARSWLGTKWQHQASLKGKAADCIGLVRGVYTDLTGITVQTPIDYPATWHLYRQEEWLYPEVAKYAEEIPVTDTQPGDVLLFGFGKGPAAHCGILVTADTFIHAYGEAGRAVETHLDSQMRKATWRDHIRAAFRFPGVTD